MVPKLTTFQTPAYAQRTKKSPTATRTRTSFPRPMHLEPQRIGDGAGDQRFRQSMSLAVTKKTMAGES